MRTSIVLAPALLAAASLASSATEAADAPPLRIGLIGLDTSHAVAFTKSLNAEPPAAEFAGVRVVAAYPGGSPDIPASADRVEGFTKQIAGMGVEIVGSIDALLPKVDAVLLLSVDGRRHLEQVRPVFAAKKPVFIDKPVAGTLADAVEIFRLAEAASVPCFSSSSLRFSPDLVKAADPARVGAVVGCLAYGPCSTEPHHPDLYWYGVHGVESLYAVMGPGCVSVVRTRTDGAEVATGVWKDGRTATFRGLRDGKAGYGVVVFGQKAIVVADVSPKYDALLAEVVTFFRTGKPPVPAAETVELFAFMEAADESKRRGGCPVLLEDVMQAAKIAGK